MNRPIMPETVKEFLRGAMIIILGTELIYWIVRPLVEHFVSSR